MQWPCMENGCGNVRRSAQCTSSGAYLPLLSSLLKLHFIGFADYLMLLVSTVGIALGCSIPEASSCKLRRSVAMTATSQDISLTFWQEHVINEQFRGADQQSLFTCRFWRYTRSMMRRLCESSPQAYHVPHHNHKALPTGYHNLLCRDSARSNSTPQKLALCPILQFAECCSFTFCVIGFCLFGCM